MTRTVGGVQVSQGLQMTMKIASAWTDPEVGDNCVLDTSANLTVKSPTDNAAVFGQLVWVNPKKDRVTVQVLRYGQALIFSYSGTVGLGDSIQVNGANSNNVDAAAADNGTLVVAKDYPETGKLLVLC